MKKIRGNLEWFWQENGKEFREEPLEDNPDGIDREILEGILGRNPEGIHEKKREIFLVRFWKNLYQNVGYNF